MEHMDYEDIKRLQADDRSAFDRLYMQYSRKIYLNALKLTKDSNIAEDIVQEVFIILWEKRMSIDPSRPLLNWIFVVSYNKAIDYLKRAFKTALVASHTLPDVHMPERQDAHSREQQLRLIEHAVQQLSPQRRRVFELCKLQGQTYESAATQLSISRHTVKEYLSAAMKNVRAYIQTAQLNEAEVPYGSFI